MRWQTTFLLLASIAAGAAIASLAVGTWALASGPADAPQSSITVTRADDGGTVTLRVGDRFLLKLGDDFIWSATVSDQSVVRRVPNILVVHGAQGVYEALREGETDLNATGTPNCPPQQPCPQIAVAFHVHLVVKGLDYRVVVPGLAADGAAGHFAVRGTVLAGPTCPVEHIPPDPGCADRPVKGAEIIFRDATGAVVADVFSDASGAFSLSLPPGTYTMEPQRVGGLLGTAPEQTIVVGTGGLDLTIHYDTGIR